MPNQDNATVDKQAKTEQVDAAGFTELGVALRASLMDVFRQYTENYDRLSIIDKRSIWHWVAQFGSTVQRVRDA